MAFSFEKKNSHAVQLCLITWKKQFLNISYAGWKLSPTSLGIQNHGMYMYMYNVHVQ